MGMRVCVRVCVRVGVRACVRACVCACVVRIAYCSCECLEAEQRVTRASQKQLA